MAWARLRPARSFSGLTLDGYKATIQPSLDLRAEISDLQARLKLAIARRKAADEVSFAALRRVAFGILADRQEGYDSPLYAAMGYVPKSLRRTGLVRKRKRKHG
ncbi:MAG: hypothetical protein WDO56_37885 [Gammaproteobacteria bacterium]